jgi:hypothetical protein
MMSPAGNAAGQTQSFVWDKQAPEICRTLARSCPSFVGLGGRLRSVVMLGRRARAGLTIWVRCRGRTRLFRRVARIRRTALLPVGLIGSSSARGALGKASTTEC